MNYQKMIANWHDVRDVVITEQSLWSYDALDTEAITQRVRDSVERRRVDTLRNPGLGYWLG